MLHLRRGTLGAFMNQGRKGLMQLITCTYIQWANFDL